MPINRPSCPPGHAAGHSPRSRGKRAYSVFRAGSCRRGYSFFYCKMARLLSLFYSTLKSRTKQTQISPYYNKLNTLDFSTIFSPSKLTVLIIFSNFKIELTIFCTSVLNIVVFLTVSDMHLSKEDGGMHRFFPENRTLPRWVQVPLFSSLKGAGAPASVVRPCIKPLALRQQISPPITCFL